jgi:hypothetical protein
MQVASLGELLEGEIIITSSALPQALLKAFLLAGCKAVVCRDAAAVAPAALAAAGFFQTLYARLQRGSTLPEVRNPNSPTALRGSAKWMEVVR